MSADNWAFCPKCKTVAEKKKAEELKDLKASYGKIPADKYALKIIETEKPIKLKETLREDYEFYMEGTGYFTANYSARCDRCSFKHLFDHQEQLKLF